MSGYRTRIAAALEDGHRVAGLHASAGGGLVRAALLAPDGTIELETAAAELGSVPSIVDLAPAVGWDEREAADLYGLAFADHQPLRPLVDHDPDLARWTVPVRGRDAYQVAVGPIHAGVIESGHFRIHVVGELILHVDVRLFYKHRGLERAAEGQTLEAGIAYAARACAACSVSSSVAYALACEEILGLRPSAELARARTILLELERAWSHLNDVSAICAGVGLAAGTALFGALADRARRLNELLTGHRFLFGTVAVGGSALELDARLVATAREELAAIEAEGRSGWRELLFNASFQDRLPGIGTVSGAEALTLGATGPAARAAGLAEDARATSPRLAYAGFVPVTTPGAAGDVQARLMQRSLEFGQTRALLDELLAAPLAAATALPGGDARSVGVGRVESPRGATLCIVEPAGGRVGRLRLRTGSYANWPVVAHAAAGELLPDFPLVNKSFELCYACVDR